MLFSPRSYILLVLFFSIDPLSYSEAEDLPSPPPPPPPTQETETPPRRPFALPDEVTPTPAPWRGRAHPGSPNEQILWKQYLKAATSQLLAKTEALANREARERALFKMDLALKSAQMRQLKPPGSLFSGSKFFFLSHLGLTHVPSWLGINLIWTVWPACH